MLSEWLVENLGKHRWKLVTFSCISVIPFILLRGLLADWVVATFLVLGILALTLGILVDPVAPSVFGRDNKSKAMNRSDFNRLLDSLTLSYMHDLDYRQHIDYISRDTVSKYKALPKAPAESIAKLYNEHLMLIKSNMRTRIGRMSDLERSLIEELERSIDIQYKYHVEQNLQDEIKALHNMNNHYADLLDYDKREPK